MMTSEKQVVGIIDILYDRLSEIEHRLEELNQDKDVINPHDFYSGFWRGTVKALNDEHDFVGRLVSIIETSR